jgi:D-serine deaminase-like pyridoxal phosphate-dependent protein
VLDAQRVNANAAMMRERARTLGVNLRPHVKTSKCLDVARIACAGKTGPITVSTLKEAEQFFAAGGYRRSLRGRHYAEQTAPCRPATASRVRSENRA